MEWKARSQIAIHCVVQMEKKLAYSMRDINSIGRLDWCEMSRENHNKFYDTQ